jgi:hypothetical protein
MNEPSVGREIKQAVQHTQLIFREVNSFLRDVEAELAELDIGSMTGAEPIFDDSSRNMSAPSGWFQAAIGRLFAKGWNVDPSSRALFVEVHLAPAQFEQAVLVFGVADAGRPLKPTALVSMYNGGGWVLSLFEPAVEFGKECVWDVSRSSKVFDGVPDLKAIVLPLDAMTGRATIRTELVERGRLWLRETPSPS